MNISDAAKAYRQKMFLEDESEFAQTDPEFVERFENFAFDEVVNEPGVELEDRTRFMAILSVLLGSQGLDAFKDILPAAIRFGVTPVEIKEIVYQAVDYLGMGRVYPFLKAVNTFLQENGIALPLAPQHTTTMETRLQAGVQAQVDLFGDRMKEAYCSGPKEKVHINRWLAANCFGDIYTRKGLDYRQREMCTFCYLYAQGGCDPQAIAHAQANMRIGNDRLFLIAVVSQCVPYIGYPRTLNALRFIEEAAK